MKKRVLSFFLCVCMLVGLFCTAPFAQAETFSGNVSPDLSWSFDSETGTLTFTGNTAIVGGGAWNMYRGQIRSIVIEEGITAIGDGAFSHNTKLTSVALPQVTAVGDYAFGSSENIASVTLGAMEKIGEYAFFETAITQLPQMAARPAP